jgi:hypothetical protein
VVVRCESGLGAARPRVCWSSGLSQPRPVPSTHLFAMPWDFRSIPNWTVCAADPTNAYWVNRHPKSALGSGRGVFAAVEAVTWCNSARPFTVGFSLSCWGLCRSSIGASARAPEVPHGHHDPVRRPRPHPAGVYQY